MFFTFIFCDWGSTFEPLVLFDSSIHRCRVVLFSNCMAGLGWAGLDKEYGVFEPGIWGAAMVAVSVC